jgi:hypothetical protein
MIKIVKRIERAEAATSKNRPSRDSHDCICFPENERPFFLYEEVEVVATRVKCPIHGERFFRVPHLYIPDWRREVEVGLNWPNRSEQYRRAWNASFHAGSWPVEEIEIAGRIWLLPRSETGELLDWRTAQTALPWKRVHAKTADEARKEQKKPGLPLEINQ